MVRHNFNHINQFQRNGHAPLTKSEKHSATEWIANQFYINPEEVKVGTAINPDTGEYVFVYKSRSTGKSLSVAELQQAAYDKILQKYPKPPQGPSRFRLKASVPLGTSEILPFGDPSIRYFGHRLFYSDISPEEAAFYHEWFHGLIREGVIRV